MGHYPHLSHCLLGDDHDFYHITGLQFDGVLISLKDELGVRLGANLLGRRYATDMIHYTNLEADFMHRPQGMAEECLRMARAFLLFRYGCTYLPPVGRRRP